MASHAVPNAEVDELTAVFSALADPTRRSILMRLMAGDASVAELAEPFDMSQPAVSKHLKVLEGAGLISRSRAATSRFSHLEARPLKEANAWMQKYKRFWNESFDRLDSALADYMKQEEDAAPTNQTKPKEEGND